MLISVRNKVNQLNIYIYIYPLCLEPRLTPLCTLFYLGLFTFNWRTTTSHLYCVGVCHILILTSHFCCLVAQLCPTLGDPTSAWLLCPSLSSSLLKLMSVELVMLTNRLILCLPSPLAFNLSQYQDLFQWVSSSHQVAKAMNVPSLVNLPLTPLNILSGLSRLILTALWSKNCY